MKTPRELLLHRHRAAAQKLDAVRRKVLADSFSSSKPEMAGIRENPISGRASYRGPAMLRALLGIFMPLRFHAAGLAAIWMVIVGMRLATPSANEPQWAATNPSSEQLTAVAEKRKLMAELMEFPLPAAGEPAKPFKPRPRSDCSPNRAVT